MTQHKIIPFLLGLLLASKGNVLIHILYIVLAISTFCLGTYL